LPEFSLANSCSFVITVFLCHFRSLAGFMACLAS
jgi:hypothetical protein